MHVTRGGKSQKPIRKAFLLAGGAGTRLRPLTNTLPKCLVPIQNRPLCDYWFALCELHGIETILMNTSYLSDPVRDYVNTLNRKVSVELVHEDMLLGSAGTIRENADFVKGEDAFYVIYADNLSNANLSAMAAFHQSTDTPFTMGVFHTDYPSQCGIATLDSTGRVIDFTEKPDNPESDLANAGLYIADISTIADIRQDKPLVDYGHDILPNYVGNMHAFPLDCYHLDIGNLESYALAENTCPKNMPL